MPIKETIGRRIYARPFGHMPLEAGCYGWSPLQDCWVVRSPAGYLSSLLNHGVTEHADGTISVYPAIIQVDYETSEEKVIWNGTLIRGVWKEIIKKEENE